MVVCIVGIVKSLQQKKDSLVGIECLYIMLGLLGDFVYVLGVMFVWVCVVVDCMDGLFFFVRFDKIISFNGWFGYQLLVLMGWNGLEDLIDF